MVSKKVTPRDLMTDRRLLKEVGEEFSKGHPTSNYIGVHIETFQRIYDLSKQVFELWDAVNAAFKVVSDAYPQIEHTFDIDTLPLEIERLVKDKEDFASEISKLKEEVAHLKANADLGELVLRIPTLFREFETFREIGLIAHRDGAWEVDAHRLCKSAGEYHDTPFEALKAALIDSL